jgi:hypothetical protein
MNEKPNTQYITSYSTLMGMLTKAKIRWLLPKDNFVKLINTDGASKDQRVACCGRIVCGSQAGMDWWICKVCGFVLCFCSGGLGGISRTVLYPKFGF